MQHGISMPLLFWCKPILDLGIILLLKDYYNANVTLPLNAWLTYDKSLVPLQPISQLSNGTLSMSNYA